MARLAGRSPLFWGADGRGGSAVDAFGALKGVVDIREIVTAEPGQTLGDIMTEHVIALPKDATLRDARMLFERYDFRALPITDESDQLLGAVSSRDIRALRPKA